jgi:alcohol dehydrogenase (NADP+)
MLRTRGYAAIDATSPLGPWEFDRREPGPHDVVIDISHCGVCHSDIHQSRDEWGGAIFPMVPGHEIVGTVSRVGSDVRAWQLGDGVGVGVFVDSCRRCEACLAGEEQYCERGMSTTYNGHEQDGTTPTYGGYSERIVVDENYVLRIPPGMSLPGTAPLLCAGITTYSPIRHFAVRSGDRTAVVGLGGLGHMAVKVLKALGAETTVLSHSPGKREDALRLGADDFVDTSAPGAFTQHSRRFDFIIDAVSAAHNYGSYLDLLRRDGTMVLVGLPDQPSLLDAAKLTDRRRRLAGSVIGGIRETQEMLDFCAERGVTADVEMIPIQDVNDAYGRMLRGDVRFRFVIDIATLSQPPRER